MVPSDGDTSASDKTDQHELRIPLSVGRRYHRAIGLDDPLLEDGQVRTGDRGLCDGQARWAVLPGNPNGVGTGEWSWRCDTKVEECEDRSGSAATAHAGCRRRGRRRSMVDVKLCRRRSARQPDSRATQQYRWWQR